MPYRVAGVEFTDAAVADIQALKPGDDLWQRFALSIAALLTHNSDLNRLEFETSRPQWARLPLSRWPTRKVWVTEIGGCKIAYEEGQTIRVHYVWEVDPFG